jgi:hypothetical protein
VDSIVMARWSFTLDTALGLARFNLSMNLIRRSLILTLHDLI